MSIASQIVLLFERVESTISRRRYIALVILSLVVVVAAVLGVFIRAAAWPLWVKINKAYIDAFDSWIEYWTAEYLYKHGLGSWWELKPPNPAVMKFWYPWGRDFTKTAYPLVPMLIAGLYPLVSGILSFQQWAAWLPPLSAALLVVVTAVLLYRRFGLLAGITGALLVALLPASTDRTLLGFIEKEGIVQFLLVLSILFLSESLAAIENRMRRRVYALLAGIMAMLVGFGWGGYPLPVGVMAFSIILLPAARREMRLEYVDIPILFFIGMLPAFIWSRWGGTLDALIGVPGALIIAAVVFIVGVWLVQRFKIPLLADILEWLFARPLVYVVLVIIATMLVGIAAALTGFVSGRISYLLLPGGLKEIVVKKLGPLVESVAEHAVNINNVITEATPLVITFALVGFLYMLYRIVERGEQQLLPVLIASSLGFYGMFNAAYLLQTGSVLSAIAAASLVGVSSEASVRIEYGRRRSYRTEWGPVLKAAGALVALLLILNAVAAIAQNYTFYSTRLPMVLTSGVTVNRYSPAWYNFLVYIRNNTPEDTIFVSWWDYGYWLSVVGNRTSLADGATMNSTQIHLLARILVGDYREAVKLLRELKCEPGRTYIVAYGVYLLVPRGNTVLAILLPFQADIAKSYWMVRIGGFRVDDYFGTVPVTLMNGQQIVANTLKIYSRSVVNALLYKLLFQAPLMLTERNVVRIIDENIAKLVSNVTIIPSLGVLTSNGVAPVQLAGMASELLTTPPGFKHAIVSASTIIRLPDGSLEVVIVAAFEWNGTTSS